MIFTDGILHAALLKAAKELPPALLEEVLAILCAADNPTEGVVRAHLADCAPLPIHRKILRDILRSRESYCPELSLRTVGELLRLAAYCEEQRPRPPELVWTGPYAQQSLRRIDQALLQLIHAAELELLIVTFAAYKVPAVRAALQEAVSRGVQIRFIAETASESGGKVTYDALHALGDALAGTMEVFIWPPDARPKDSAGKHGSLHAKCAVADRRFALLTSANLTDYALNLNIEAGVLLTGGDLPAELAAQFDRLIQQGTLCRWYQ